MPSSTACSIASSPAAAASAPASTRRSTAATARAISPTMCARTAAAPRPRSISRETDLLTVHQIHSTDVLTVAERTLDLARRAQGRCAGDRPAGRRAGRDGGRLRAGAAGRCRRRRDRRRPCRLEGRAGRRRRGDDRRHGDGWAPGASTCAPRSAPASAATPTRSGRNSPRRSWRRTRPTPPSSAPPPRAGHFLFDLAGYLAHRIAHGGVAVERDRPRHAGGDATISSATAATRCRACATTAAACRRSRSEPDVPYLIILVFCCLLGVIATCAML